jgi:hypothetical protein
MDPTDGIYHIATPGTSQGGLGFIPNAGATSGSTFNGSAYIPNTDASQVFGAGGRTFNGSAQGEGGFNFGQVIEHARLRTEIGIRVTIPGLLWKNKFHEQYQIGTPIFSIAGSIPKIESANGFGTSVASMPQHSTQTALVTLAQANAMLRQIEATMQTEASKAGVNATTQKKSTTTMIYTGSSAPNVPVTSGRTLRNLLELPEDQWDLMGTDKDLKVKYPLVGWCNSQYVSENLRLCGIVQSVEVIEATNTVYVSVSPQCASQTIGFWPSAETNDYVGFALTRLNCVKPFEHAQQNPLVILPWFSHVAKFASHYDDLFKVPNNQTLAMHRRDSNAPANRVYVYNLGRVTRNDNNIWINTLGSNSHQRSAERDAFVRRLAGIVGADGAISPQAAFDETRQVSLSMLVSISLSFGFPRTSTSLSGTNGGDTSITPSPQGHSFTWEEVLDEWQRNTKNVTYQPHDYTNVFATKNRYAKYRADVVNFARRTRYLNDNSMPSIRKEVATAFDMTMASFRQTFQTGASFAKSTVEMTAQDRLNDALIKPDFDGASIETQAHNIDTPNDGDIALISQISQTDDPARRCGLILIFINDHMSIPAVTPAVPKVSSPSASKSTLTSGVNKQLPLPPAENVSDELN